MHDQTGHVVNFEPLKALDTSPAFYVCMSKRRSVGGQKRRRDADQVWATCRSRCRPSQATTWSLAWSATWSAPGLHLFCTFVHHMVFMWHSYTIHKHVLDISSALYESSSQKNILQKVQNKFRMHLTTCIWNVISERKWGCWWWWRWWWRSQWLWWCRWWWSTVVGIQCADQVWTTCRPSGDEAGGGPNLGRLPAWSPLIHQLVFSCRAQPIQKIHFKLSRFLWFQFAMCTWHFMHNWWTQFTIWRCVLIPSGHACSWMNVCIESHMQICSMCAEQCANAPVVHVCNALCADVYVCAPLCACSAVVHLGLHANRTLKSLCLWLESEGACWESISQNVSDMSHACCLQFIDCTGQLQVINRPRKHSNTSLWNAYRQVTMRDNTRAFLRIVFIKCAWHVTVLWTHAKWRPIAGHKRCRPSADKV